MLSFAIFEREEAGSSVLVHRMLQEKEGGCYRIEKAKVVRKKTPTEALAESLKDSDADTMKKKNKCKENTANVLCMDGASIVITDEGYPIFLRNYARDVMAMHKQRYDYNMPNYFPRFYMTEVARTKGDVVRIWFEMDIFYQSRDFAAATTARSHQESEFLGQISKHLIDTIRSCFVVQRAGRTHISVIVQTCKGEKAMEKTLCVNSDYTSWKSGLHIHVPEIFITVENLAALRVAYAERLQHYMSDLSYYGIVAPKPNTPVLWTDIIDPQPIGAGRGLRMPGSYKSEACNSCPPKRTDKCTVCRTIGKVHIDKMYWPEVWFYEQVCSDESVSVRMFPDKNMSNGDFKAFPLRNVDMRDYIFLVSTKTNGARVHASENGFEAPFKARQTQTSGFMTPILDKGSIPPMNKKRKTDDGLQVQEEVKQDGHDPLMSEATGCFVSPVVVMHSQDVDLSTYDDILRDAMSRPSTDFMMREQEKKIQEPVAPRRGPQLPAVLYQEVYIQPDPWRVVLNRHGHGVPCRTPTVHIGEVTKLGDNVPWKDVQVNVINGGMIPSSHVNVKVMLDNAPLVVKQSMLAGKMQSMPHVLCIFIIPKKNTSSRFCPIAGREHESNNIYFQLLFPVNIHRFQDSDMEHILWTARVLRMLTDGTMEATARLQRWPIMVRCFREACSKKCKFYAASWPYVLRIIEPMVTRMLNDHEYRKSSRIGEFELAVQ